MNNVNLEVVQGEIVESAEQVHNRICSNFDKVEKTLYEICVDLKSIRDNKYYKTLGYNTFEDYCLENFNMSRFNAYKYISIAENLSDNFVAMSQQKQIGLNKLYVLSRLTDEERSELMQTTDIEHTPVKALEQKSKEIKENKAVSESETSATASISTSKESQFINRYGKKMNALLIYLRDDFRKIANSLKYENFVDKYPMDLVNIESLYNDVKALECFLFSVREICSNPGEHLQEHSANKIKAILLGEKKI